MGTAQIEYHIALDDVRCTDRNWKSCSYTTSHDCTHGQVIYLSCATVPDYGNTSTVNISDISCLSAAFLIMLCISLRMIVKRNAKIDDLTKKCAETDRLVEHLRDQLKVLQNSSKASLKTDLEESSGGEYQDILGPD
jgi:hypothetical protein